MLWKYGNIEFKFRLQCLFIAYYQLLTLLGFYGELDESRYGLDEQGI